MLKGSLLETASYAPAPLRQSNPTPPTYPLPFFRAPPFPCSLSPPPFFHPLAFLHPGAVGKSYKSTKKCQILLKINSKCPNYTIFLQQPLSLASLAQPPSHVPTTLSPPASPVHPFSRRLCAVGKSYKSSEMWQILLKINSNWRNYTIFLQQARGWWWGDLRRGKTSCR